MNKHKVTFRFETEKEKVVTVEVRHGDTVLDAALDNDIHLNHNCGAVCACRTCQVYIDKGMEHLPEISDKEEDLFVYDVGVVNPKEIQSNNIDDKEYIQN